LRVDTLAWCVWERKEGPVYICFYLSSYFHYERRLLVITADVLIL
jgi:hypothetical protein